MKIKGLLISMLACTAMLVGCSDDVIDTGESLDVKKGDAYISLSIDSSTSSSRAQTGGDIHPDADDNGHHNAGTTAENEVKSILLVLTSGADGKVDLFELKGEGDNKVLQNETGETFNKINGGGYELSKPYHMKNQGTYKALIIINPTETLLTAINGKEHATAYQTVLDYQYSSSGETNDAAMADFYKNGFMMANKEECTIPVNPENNSSTNPAVGEIEVERVISKVTFRPKNNNVYPVTINITEYDPITAQGWYISGYKADGDKQIPIWSFATLNKIQEVDGDGNNYWIQVADDANTDENVLASSKILGVYLLAAGEEHEGYDQEGNAIEIKDVYTVVEKDNYPETFTLDRGTSSSDNDNYYVKLEGYALTNLSKAVYGVRHIAKDNYADIKEMGKLDGTNIYLVDPYSISKNQVKFTAAGEFSGTPTVDTWFFNKLSAVAAEGNALVNTEDYDDDFWASTTYFKALPTSIKDGNQEVVDTPHDNINQIGQHLSYCFENAVLKTLQLPGLVTGIVFVGQIYTDAECSQRVPVMFKYKKIFYRDLRELLDNNSNDSALSGLTENSTASEVEAAEIEGMEVYKDGRCFYFCSEIKHYDDGITDYKTDDTGDYVLDANGNKIFQGGVMEFAIMRNNIYSLEINNITSIGSSVINPIPGNAVEDSGAYLTMRCSILPWIVRFNNINF